MSESKIGILGNRRKVWIGISVAIASVVVAAQYFDFPPSGKDGSGTIVPAQRYRAAQPTADVGGQTGTTGQPTARAGRSCCGGHGTACSWCWSAHGSGARSNAAVSSRTCIRSPSSPAPGCCFAATARARDRLLRGARWIVGRGPGAASGSPMPTAARDHAWCRDRLRDAGRRRIAAWLDDAVQRSREAVVAMTVEGAWLAAVFVASAATLAAGTYNPFIYFRF